MIQLQHVNARFGQFTLNDITLRVPAGHYCVLLGPPGSGKTSIVEIVCGLRPKLDGRVTLDNCPADLTDPADRQVGYVPQDYALFPTLDVRGNIAFGLSIRHRPHREIRDRVGQTARRLKIEHLLDRSCRGLSGGERQRVALARALVLEPKILLLDEPVSALDESTRQQVCLELRNLHDALGMTTIHISHNFEETRSVADMIGVINNGRIVQAGTVEQVFTQPDTEFVARFVQAGNILHGMVNADAGTSIVSRAVPGPGETGGGSLVELVGAKLTLQRTLAPNHVAQPPSAVTRPPEAGEIGPGAGRSTPEAGVPHLRCAVVLRYPGRLPPGPAALLLRLHDATIQPPGEPVPPGWAALPGTVVSVHDNGGFQVTVRVAVTMSGTEAAGLSGGDVCPAELLSVALLKRDDQPLPWRAGDRVQAAFNPARLRPLIADM